MIKRTVAFIVLACFTVTVTTEGKALAASGGAAPAAGGDAEKVKKAHKQLLYVVIALIVGAMAYGAPALAIEPRLGAGIAAISWTDPSARLISSLTCGVHRPSSCRSRIMLRRCRSVSR